MTSHSVPKLSSTTYAKRYGDIKQRLMAKGERQADGCLLWRGVKRDHEGYGAIKINGQRQRVHRVAYEVFCGPIPPGFNICHTCDTPACFEPSHLRACSQQQNMREMAARARAANA